MYPFVVLLGLALALAVVGEVVDELSPVKIPSSLRRTGSVLVAMAVCWALNYSVFTVFGQHLREAWMNPVASGIVLIGVGEFLRVLVGGLGFSMSFGSRDRTKTA
ncbi:MAG TPA: hypothetical protein VNG13_09175 [Mycobacteriales bacterium]|nr:hypothetical protein [Mycobacteriales bacterium]